MHLCISVESVLICVRSLPGWAFTPEEDIYTLADGRPFYDQG